MLIQLLEKLRLPKKVRDGATVDGDRTLVIDLLEMRDFKSVLNNFSQRVSVAQRLLDLDCYLRDCCLDLVVKLRGRRVVQLGWSGDFREQVTAKLETLDTESQRFTSAFSQND